MKKDEIRAAAAAGGFYPASATAIKQMIKGFLDRVPDRQPDGEVVAAVAPHAGYVYSGQVAAHVHKALSKTVFDTIVIIGHDCHIPGVVAIVSPADHFETPLGRIAVDREMIAAMRKANDGIKEDRAIHAREHSVEVQIPFIQYSEKKCRIVPVLFGDPTVENCESFAKAIAGAAGARKVVVLASTDMCHYPSHDDSTRIDRATLDVLTGLDVRKLFSRLREVESAGDVEGLQTAMCSRGGVGTALFFAKMRGADKAQVLAYANSGDVPIGDRSRVVGYGAALIMRPTH